MRNIVLESVYISFITKFEDLQNAFDELKCDKTIIEIEISKKIDNLTHKKENL